MALVHCVWISHLMKHNCFMFSNHFPFFSEAVYSCFLLGSVDRTRSFWPSLSTLKSINYSRDVAQYLSSPSMFGSSHPPISSLII
ncbi:hypothetical protein NC651_039388 [Populus alba x Populus x berolinensis]|nr:hypothetical protein NC651_039388 [Populus alba x Populus x berolinensis]